MNAASTDLPHPLSSFINRERERAAIKALLLGACPRAASAHERGVRLLTLTGPAGAGKTRLAIEAARELRDDQAVPVYFVALAPLSNADLVLPAIARSLGIPETGAALLSDRVEQALRPRRLLLLLDNAEHVLGAAPALVHLLESCPLLQLLITSRSLLGVYGEQEFSVRPLTTPVHIDPSSLDQLAASDSVRLFVERARSVRPDFTLTAENAAAVAAICIRLEGLPLAIELAAVRTRLLSPPALLGRLESRLKLLTSGPRHLPERQQTLRGALSWSYDLLSEPERKLFRRLTVFSGGCTLEAAESVTSDSGQGREGTGDRGQETGESGSGSSPPSFPGKGAGGLGNAAALSPQPSDVLDALASLIEKSLIVREDSAAGESRFDMLETVCEYALERLAESGEEATIRRRHAEYYLALAEAAEKELKGPRQGRALDLLEREHANLRAALSWSSGRGETAIRLTAALWRFWYIRGHLADADRWLNYALAPNRDAPAAARAKALQGAANLAWRRGEYDGAQKLAAESLSLATAARDVPGAAFALHLQGLVAREQGRLDLAEEFHRRSLALYEEHGDDWGKGLERGHLGVLAQRRGDVDAALACFGEALALNRSIGDEGGAAVLFDAMGLLAEEQGDRAEALRCYRESLSLHRGLRDAGGVAAALVRLAGATAAMGSLEPAAKLFGAADALGAPLGGLGPSAHRDYRDRHLAALRADLGTAAFAAAWSEGRELSADRAIAFAVEQAAARASELSDSGSHEKAELMDRPKEAVVYPHGLSSREIEVLRLIASGKSNRQIAEELALSIHTVERHSSNIYAKSGISGKAAAIAFALRLGLLDESTC